MLFAMHDVAAARQTAEMDQPGFVIGTAGTDAGEARWVPLADVAEMLLVPGLAEFLHEHGVIDTIA